ncbi:MAG TPA: hypothetical protein VNV66_17705 [Pilimelia sp.]|nr:hypothetical protein [Pilimelia sp.]
MPGPAALNAGRGAGAASPRPPARPGLAARLRPRARPGLLRPPARRGLAGLLRLSGRRGLLALLGALVAAGALAGCAGPGEDSAQVRVRLLVRDINLRT